MNELFLFVFICLSKTAEKQKKTIKNHEKLQMNPKPKTFNS